jgi:hypothetical protein
LAKAGGIGKAEAAIKHLQFNYSSVVIRMKGMNPAITSHDAFDRAIEPLIKVFSRDQAAQIASFHADTELQVRIEELASKPTKVSSLKANWRNTKATLRPIGLLPFCKPRFRG